MELNNFAPEPDYTSTVISVLALIISFISLYYQLWRKSYKLLFNQVTRSSYPLHTGELTAYISISNQGNSPLLLTDINFIKYKLNSYITTFSNVSETNLPCLFAPGEVKLFFIHTTKGFFGMAKNEAAQYDVSDYIIDININFTIVAAGILNSYSVPFGTLHITKQNPNSVGFSTNTFQNGENILNKKYKMD